MPASASVASQSKPEELVEGLSSLDTSARLKALRDVKNQIIGNKTKKLSYIKLGAVPRVVEILASDTDIPLLVQSAAAVGSFACGNDAGVRAVLDSGVFPHLLKTLSNVDDKVVEAGARSLRMIFQSTLAPCGDLWRGHAIDSILVLLSSTNDNVAEVAASVLARSCGTFEHQQMVAASGGMKALVQLLNGSTKKRQAALDALAAMVRDNPQQATAFIGMDGGQWLDLVVRLVKDKVTRSRLLACLCLTNIWKASPIGLGQHDLSMKATVLAMLVRLSHEVGQVGEEAPVVLETLVSGSEEMQNLALYGDVIPLLGSLLLNKSDVSHRQLQAILNALGAICFELEECRRQFLEHNEFVSVLSYLNHMEAGVRTAACSVIRSLSRSVKNLRTGMSSDRVVLPLTRLLRDSSPLVQASALSALCNIVLDFTPSKSPPLQSGLLPLLVSLSRSMDTNLRLNSVWALKNLSYMAEVRVKDTILKELTVGGLVNLVQDSEEDVQEQALGLIRNISHGKTEDIERITELEGGAILLTVGRQLSSARKPSVCLQAIMTMSNIATGSPSQRDKVIEILFPEGSSLPEGPLSSLLHRFFHDSSFCALPLRISALFCIENLSRPLVPGGRGRVERMERGGVEQQLVLCTEDSCLEIKSRAEIALKNFAAVKKNEIA